MAETELTAVQLTICSYGDLKLSLQTSTINATYLVSSHLLCSASPIFRASLGPSSRFAEAIEFRRSQEVATATSVSDDSLYIMRIGGDLGFDPTAMAVVLYIIHGRVGHIPETIEFKNLLDIAIICDYYECAGAMSPWNKAWMQPLEKLALEPGYEDWLFIAFLFGNQELFGKITKAFARNGVQKDGEFVVMVNGEVKKMHSRLPEGIARTAPGIIKLNILANFGIAGDMASRRAKAGEEVVRVCNNMYDKYSDKSKVKCQHGQKYCDYIVFAALHMEWGLFEKKETKKKKKKKKHNKEVAVDTSRTLESTIGDFTKLLNTIRQNLGTIQIGGCCHSNCIPPLDQQAKEFDSCLNSIAGLKLTSYSKKPREMAWNAVLKGNNASSNSYLNGPSLVVGYPWKDKTYVEICRYVDMEICYKTSTPIDATFLVSSHALRSASPVFRDLFGPKLECPDPTRRGAMQVIPLGEEHRTKYAFDKVYDPTVLTVVFHALHGQVEKLPVDIQFPHLVELARVCEEYQCTSTLLPLCQKWIEQWRWAIKEPGYEDWLYIAWDFCLDDIFQTLSRKFSTGAFPEGTGRKLVLYNDVEVKLCESIQQRIIGMITIFQPITIQDTKLKSATGRCNYNSRKRCKADDSWSVCKSVRTILQRLSQ